MTLIEFIGVEKNHLEYFMNLRNKYKKYLRQSKILSMKDQCEWYENNKDLIYTVIDENKVIGAAGFTYIDYINKKAELSFITENYIDERSSSILVMLQYIGFNELNFNKLWVEIYDFDTSKEKILIDCGFKKEAVLKDTYFHENYHDSYIYTKFRGD
jgi:RimJ/RimL family protein N-acetyltransferase